MKFTKFLISFASIAALPSKKIKLIWSPLSKALDHAIVVFTNGQFYIYNVNYQYLFKKVLNIIKWVCIQYSLWDAV